MKSEAQESRRKQARVRAVFDRAAMHYDLMNDLMSLGLHRLWKEALIGALDLPRGTRAYALLDLAGGSGDVALGALKRGGAGCSALVCDVNPRMLMQARGRVSGAKIDLLCADAAALPLRSRSFDACACAFGVRNMSERERSLKEARRILKTGGRFACLEFSRPKGLWAEKIYDLYTRSVIPPLARLVTGDARPYSYLLESIETFPAPGVFADMLRGAGFERISQARLGGGAVILSLARRL